MPSKPLSLIILVLGTARRGTKSRKVTKKVSTSPRLCWLLFAKPDILLARSRTRMPRGPKGEKRPADVIGAAVMVGRIATGELDDLTTEDGKNAAAVALIDARDERKAKRIAN